MVEVAGELPFPVSDLRDLGQRPFEILLHEATDGVQLQPDPLDPASTTEKRETGTGKRGRTDQCPGGSDKRAAIHVSVSSFTLSVSRPHSSLPFRTSPAWFPAPSLRALSVILPL